MLKPKRQVERRTPAPRKPKGGARKLVLLLGDDGVILILTAGTRVLKRAFALSPDEMDSGPFREMLRSEPSAPILLLVDLMDQTFVQHNLPPVSSLNVTKLAQRRLERDFSADDLNGFVQMGRSTEGRKEWYYIFASVPNVPPLSRWVERLAELPNPFMGIHLLPMELQPVIPRLGPGGGRKARPAKGEVQPERWHILVSHHKVGGVRQVVLRNGKLVFTRMSQMVGEDAPAVNAGNIEQEISSTKEYLKRLGLGDRAEVYVSVVLAEEVHPHIDTKRIGATLVDVMTPYQFAESLGLAGAVEPNDRFGDIACMVAVARQRRMMMPLQTRYTAQIRQFSQIRQLVRVLGVIAAPLMLAYSGYMFYQGIALNGQIGVQKDQLASLNRTLAGMETKKQELPGELAVINEYSDIHDKLMEETHSPLELVSRMLAVANGRITATKIDFNAQPLSGLGGPASAPPPPPGQEQEQKPAVTIVLSLQFSGYGQDIGAFTTDANAALTVLKTNFPLYKISYSRLPGTYSEEESLTVSFGKDRTKALPDELVVDYTIAGPFPPDPNAAPAAGGPP